MEYAEKAKTLISSVYGQYFIDPINNFKKYQKYLNGLVLVNIWLVHYIQNMN